MRRYTSLRSNIVRRHQLPFRLMPLPYRRWGRRWGRGLNKFAHAVALKVHIAAGFVTSKVAALATFGCRGRRRVAYSSDATIHDPLHGLILGLPSAVPHVFERHSAAMSTAAVGSGVPLARNSLMERKWRIIFSQQLGADLVFVAQFNVDAGQGGAFGMAVSQSDNGATSFAAVNDNTSEMMVLSR
jgi:hypothetical protein